MNRKQPVLLLLSNRNTFEIISEILAPGFELLNYSKPDDILTAHVSLIIADDLMVREYQGVIELKKQEEKPVDLPVLLVVQNNGNRPISEKSFDEMIMMPIHRAELLKRVETLLRLRSYSIETGHLKEELDVVRKLHTDLALQDANIGMWDWDLETGELNYSPIWKSQLGYSAGEIQNSIHEWSSRLHPDDKEPAIRKQDQYIKNPKGKLVQEFRLQHKDGSYRWILSTSALIKDENGQKTRLLGTHIDITEHKRAEKELQQSELRFKLIFEHSLAVMLLIDPETHAIVSANKAAENFYGWTKAELSQMKIDDINILSGEEIQKEINKARKSERIYFRFQHRLANHQIRDVEVYTSKVEINERPYLFSIIHDISEQRKAEISLLESERKYRYLFANNPMPMWIYDLKTLQFLEVNQAAVSHYGYTENEFRSMTLKDIRPVEEIDRLMNDVRVDHPEINKAGIWRHIKKNGETIFVEIISHLITYENKPARLVLANDVSQRKLAETALKESEERYKSLLDEAPVGIAVHSDGKIVFVNPAGTRLLKADDESQLIGKPLNSIIHPDNQEEASIRIKRLMAGEKGLYPVEDIYKCLDGTEINVEVIATLLAYKNKPAVQVIVSDITDRKRKEKEISLLNKRLGILIESVKQLAAAQSVEKVQQIVTDAGRKLVNSDGSAIVFLEEGECYYAFENTHEPLWLGSRFPAEECIGGWVMMNQQPAIIEDVYNDPRIPVEFYQSTYVKSLVMVPVTEKEVIGAIGIYFKNRYLPTDAEVNLLQTLADAAATAIGNIWLYNELEDRVNERTRQLLAVNKELETFTYSVSHDLKAPLRGIDGYSKLLVDLYGDQMNDEAKHFIGIIRNSTLHMNRLIDDLLSYSRLERSHFRVEKIDVTNFLQSILNTYRHELEEAGIVVETLIPEIELVADSTGLSVILRNFIENAIKFTRNNPAPNIQIKLSENQDSCVISVKDNGIGFDMKYHSRIFEIFQRLHRAEDFPGTGIGLALVSKAVGRMGGKTWASSTPGEGATFFVEIPKSFSYDTK